MYGAGMTSCARRRLGKFALPFSLRLLRRDSPPVARWPLFFFRLLLCLALLIVIIAVISTSASPVSAASMINARASTSSYGEEGTGTAPFTTNPALYGSGDSGISGDGRYVVFSSGADNLVPGDTNNVADIFRKDTWTGEIVRVSTGAGGEQSNGSSERPAISDDGRYVVFDSGATNLMLPLPDGNAGYFDIFVKDMGTGAVMLASSTTAGAWATPWGSVNSNISADGRYVVFASYAENLVGSDLNEDADIFRKDFQTGQTIRISTDSSGGESDGPNHTPADGDSNYPAISSDGRYVAFYSAAVNLVPQDGNGFNDVFLKDTQTGQTTRLSTTTGGTEGTGHSERPAISDDGLYVVFYSDATNLIGPGQDMNGFTDVFLKNISTGGINIVSRDEESYPADGPSRRASISENSRFVAFESAANLVPEDANGDWDIYLADNQTGSLRRLNTSCHGEETDTGPSSRPAISSDGRYISYHAIASNLAPSDTNGIYDVFITRAGPNLAFAWYDNLYAANWILFANPNNAASDAWFDLSIAGEVKELPEISEVYASGQVPAGSTLAARYTGIMGGPVDAGYQSLSPAMVSQRTLWAGSSLEEVAGAETTRLSDHFYWTWYDMQSSGFRNWVLVSNPGVDQVYYRIKIGGEVKASGAIDPGANVTPTFPGVMGGPVEVQAWSDAVGGSVPAMVIASQRVLTNNDTAFNELPGIPAEELASDYVWTWYDMQSPGAANWVLVANPPMNAFAIYYEIWIGATKVRDGGPVSPGATDAPTFPGTMGGPVRVRIFSDVGHTNPASAICSQRSIFGPSFEEVPGFAGSGFAGSYLWTWYDEQAAGSKNWVLVANPLGPGAASVTIRIAGVTRWTGVVEPGQSQTPRFPGIMDGPVEVIATGSPVIASQRVLWNGYFNEVVGAPQA